MYRLLLVTLLAGVVAGAPSWSYHAQERWVIDYPACGGQSQSPIDLASAASVAELKPFSFTWGVASAFNLTNNGHTFQVSAFNSGPMLIDPNTGVEYELKQFHFHTPSEHLWGNSHRDLEVHLVHIRRGVDINTITTGQDLLVVGVTFQQSTYGNSELLNTFWANLTNATGSTLSFQGTTLDLRSGMPSSRDYVSYIGSLTNPPCYEGVRWYVMDQPVHVSSKQVAWMRNRLGLVESSSPTQFTVDGIARWVQPLNGRVVMRYTDAAYPSPSGVTQSVAISAIVIAVVAFVAVVGIIVLLILRMRSQPGKSITSEGESYAPK